MQVFGSKQTITSGCGGGKQECEQLGGVTDAVGRSIISRNKDL